MKLLHGFTAAQHIGIAIQTAQSRTTLYNSNIVEPNKQHLLNELPYVDIETGDLLNQLGDFHTNHGTVTMSPQFNTAIYDSLTTAVRLAFAVFSNAEMFTGLQFTSAQRLAIREALLTRVLVGGVPRAPKILTGDEAGSITIRQIIGRHYAAYVNT